VDYWPEGSYNGGIAPGASLRSTRANPVSNVWPSQEGKYRGRTVCGHKILPLAQGWYRSSVFSEIFKSIIHLAPASRWKITDQGLRWLLRFHQFHRATSQNTKHEICIFSGTSFCEVLMSVKKKSSNHSPPKNRQEQEILRGCRHSQRFQGPKKKKPTGGFILAKKKKKRKYVRQRVYQGGGEKRRT